MDIHNYRGKFDIRFVGNKQFHKISELKQEHGNATTDFNS